MNQVTTKADLERMGMDVLNKERAGQVTVSHRAGGIAFTSVLEIMEVAKLMAISGNGVPPHCRLNPGLCLRIVWDAVEWEMKPFSVADQSFEVNGRLCYQSQLIHGVIEKRAPIVKPLECAYEGEGPDRICIVSGTFANGEVRDYRSPKFKDIRTKNSKLWSDDTDQQFWYYASRSWARKWCPHVILGIYAREEAATIAPDTPDTGSQLKARLAMADRSEGHNPDKAAAELDNVAAGAKVTILPPDPPKNEDGTPKRRRFGKRKGGAVGQATSGDTDTTSGDTAAPQQEAQVQQPEGAPPAAQTEPAATQHAPEPETASQDDPPAPAEPPKQPTTGPEYIVYADRWIEAETDKENALARWEGDDPMRNDLMVSVRARITLLNKIKAKFGIEE